MELHFEAHEFFREVSHFCIFLSFEVWELLRRSWWLRSAAVAAPQAVSNSDDQI